MFLFNAYICMYNIEKIREIRNLGGFPVSWPVTAGMFEFETSSIICQYN